MTNADEDGKSRFTVAAKPMHPRAEVDPTRIRDLDAKLEVERYRVLTTRLARETTTQ
jgi:hypothetical protein